MGVEEEGESCVVATKESGSVVNKGGNGMAANKGESGMAVKEGGLGWGFVVGVSLRKKKKKEKGMYRKLGTCKPEPTILTGTACMGWAAEGGVGRESQVGTNKRVAQCGGRRRSGMRGLAVRVSLRKKKKKGTHHKTGDW